MPVGYKIDKERKLVMSTAYGAVTREDMLFHQQRLLADPDFDRTYSQLADFTSMGELKFGAKDVELFAANDVFAPQARRAIVVADDASFRIARMFEVLRSSKGENGIRVFRTIEEGIDWVLPLRPFVV